MYISLLLIINVSLFDHIKIFSLSLFSPTFNRISRIGFTIRYLHLGISTNGGRRGGGGSPEEEEEEEEEEIV